jgi:hypothetical protein
MTQPMESFTGTFADCQLPTANCQLPTANCKLQTANCQLTYLIMDIADYLGTLVSPFRGRDLIGYGCHSEPLKVHNSAAQHALTSQEAAAG